MKVVYVLEEDWQKSFMSLVHPIGAAVTTREEADAYVDKDPGFRGWREISVFETAEEAESWSKTLVQGAFRRRVPLGGVTR